MLQPTPTGTGSPESEVAHAELARATAQALTLDPSWRAGRKLAEARRQLGLSLEQVADRIRIRREFLAALEAMNVKLLPGKAYALAFLRSYARALGLDEAAIVEQFQDECALTREDAQKQIRNPSSRPHPERPWVAAAALVAIAAGFVGWRALDQDGQAAQQGAVVTDAGGVVAPSRDQAGPAGERRFVEILALAPSWIEARGPDGTVFLSRTLEAGDVYRPDPSPGWTLHARDGGAFEVYVNGASAGPLGQAGMPVLGRRIDEIRPVTQASTGARS